MAENIEQLQEFSHLEESNSEFLINDEETESNQSSVYPESNHSSVYSESETESITSEEIEETNSELEEKCEDLELIIFEKLQDIISEVNNNFKRSDKSVSLEQVKAKKVEEFLSVVGKDLDILQERARDYQQKVKEYKKISKGGADEIEKFDKEIAELQNKQMDHIYVISSNIENPSKRRKTNDEDEATRI